MPERQRAVAADETRVRRGLEGRIDEGVEEGDLPSGDALAAELTRFLRERDEDGGDDPPVAREQ